MTWFRDNGRDYVMWSDRKIHYGADDEHFEAGTADVYIATVDPKKHGSLQASRTVLCALCMVGIAMRHQ